MGIFSKLFTSHTEDEHNSFDWILSHIQGLPSSEELKNVAEKWKTVTDAISEFYDNFKTVELVVKNVLSKQLENISASDIGARPDTWIPTSEEVGARPNTWTPTAADVGAPSINIGWGGLPSAVISTEVELDNAKTPGAYKFAILHSNLNNIPINYGLLVVLAYDDNEIHQFITPVNTNIILERHYNNGVWGVWFCKNPPLEYGVEYRITPTVYRKRELLDVHITSENGMSDTVYTKTYANVAHFNKVYAAFGVTENDFPDKLMPYNYMGEVALIQTVAQGSILFRVGGGICVEKLYLDLEYVKSS